MPVVVGVVVLDILVMDLVLGADQVQTSQSQGPNGTNYGKDGGNAAGGNYVGGGGGGIGQNGQASATHPAAPGSPAGGGNGLMIPICPPNYGTQVHHQVDGGGGGVDHLLIAHPTLVVLVEEMMATFTSQTLVNLWDGIVLQTFLPISTLVVEVVVVLTMVVDNQPEETLESLLQTHDK